MIGLVAKKQGVGEQVIVGIYKIIPLIILFSILSFIGNYEGRIFEIVKSISEVVFLLIVPIMAAFIGRAIMGNYAFIPAFFIGALADYSGMGFLGGIVSGLLLGYIALFFENQISSKHKYIRIKIELSYMLSILIGFVLSGVLIYFVIAPPIQLGLEYLMTLLINLQSGNLIIMVMVLSGMTAFDMGGPVNKVAFSFVLAAYTNGLYEVTGPALIGVTIPPLMMGLIILIFYKKYSVEERKNGRNALFLSLVGITEGALPFAIKEPLRVVPAVVIGSMVGSGFAAYFHMSNVLMLASVGGAFGSNNLLIYILSHLIGITVGMAIYFLSKKTILK